MQPITDRPSTPLVELVILEPLDAEAVPRVRRLLDDVIALRPTHLVVDLSDCTMLDAAGIDLLVQAHRQVWGDGGRLSLIGLSARLHRLLAIARVDRVLHTTPAPTIPMSAAASHRC
jgi:anti-anti-sigma factor